VERILVVDDEPVVRRFAARILASEGYRVTEAADGQEALDLISSEGPLDLVLTDVMMPRLTGVELLELLSVSHPRVPVLLMSGYGASQLAERGIATPCALLTKPFPPRLLLDEVKRCLPSDRQ
jgi:two-component system, cell cycle sensor histidine kinase and response regulator CckA